ncbi:uncharacterized protein LOC126717352 isoform X3 [Quercus robur]|uniref:uncharacterized protein LOC126717352 isoform X3 n=1 Tax=Quercus robur TaxID=38942 RepID=UPI0021634AE5|nr:uncharacterized protein LOC126717352 isoform X3 [Quercus robur]
MAISVSSPLILRQRLQVHGPRCSSATPDNNHSHSKTKTKTKTPQVLKLVVSGVTELLRLFSSSNDSSSRLERERDEKREEIEVSGIDDVVLILNSDYENAYFVTGVFTSAIYAEDCIFEDPTIRFRVHLRSAPDLPYGNPMDFQIFKDFGINSKANFVLATWNLRTYLKLPWRPLICIDGSTIYELDDKFKIIRHAESWNVSALEAIGQIFTPRFGRPND